ncbi:uncharacterized protein LOC124313483 [Daphnia pulicaria]|uniref:uncharacterized protein LOC124313483 n=1 Tax=Daphnia pulicaria TaxID=35523 RepID=UPI001EEA5C8A|nr:uncharacterized protein LOC124313483 [Daphnia pulicaria]
MLFPCKFQSISTTCFGFLSAALLYVSLAMAEAEETNNILHFRLKKTMRSENKQDGLDVIFPGYYPDSLPVDLPENKTTTADPIHADGNSTAPKRKSTSGYPVDWSAVAELYYRSVDGGSRRNPPAPSS